MAVDEERRLALYRTLEEVLGRREATTMMEFLPPLAWGDVAHQSDLIVMKSDISALRRDISELQKDVAEIRRDMAERMATKGDVSIACNELRAEMHQGFGAVRTDFAAIIAAQTRSMVLLIFGSLLTITAIAFAAAGIR